MDDRKQFKVFIKSLLDLQRDNFIELLRNPEFQNNSLKQKETAVHYVNELFKVEMDNTIDAYMDENPTPK
jgi:hypothetical protein